MIPSENVYEILARAYKMLHCGVLSLPVCFPQTNKESTPKVLQENKNHLMSKIICEQSNVILAKRSS